MTTDSSALIICRLKENDRALQSRDNRIARTNALATLDTLYELLEKQMIPERCLIPVVKRVLGEMEL